MTSIDTQLRIEFGFEPDPDRGEACDPDLSASWGWFQIWAGEENLCRHLSDLQVSDRTLWYLLPMLEWLVKNWDRLLHESRLPKGLPNEVSARDSYLAVRPFDLPEKEADEVFAWWSCHALRATAEGGIFPDVFIRRHRDDVEVSWGHASTPGAPEDLRFLQSRGVLWTKASGAAHALHHRLGKAIHELLARCPSQRVQHLNKAYDMLRKPPSERGHWLLGAPALPNWARGFLDDAVPDVVIATTPAPIALFGSLSPTIDESDIQALLRVLRDAECDLPVCPLPSLSGDGVLASATRPWEQGYRWAERAHEGLNVDLSEAPIAIDDCLRRVNVAVKTVSLRDPKVRAVALCGGSMRPTIALNTNCSQNHSEPGRRFTMAHELCHLLYDQQYGVPLAIASGPWAPKEIEQRANAFAAMFLMPEAIVRTLASQFVPRGQWNSDALRSIASTLQIGRLPALRHLKNLELIDASEFELIQSELAG